MPAYVPEAATVGVNDDYFSSSQFLLVEEGFVMKTASISEEGFRIAYGQGISHRVGSGESIASLAELYSVTQETIRWANDLEESDIIHPGETLVILPVDGVLHTVRRGQSLSKISALYEIPIDRIVRQNKIEDGRIFAGQQIIVPDGTPLSPARIASDPRPILPANPPPTPPPSTPTAPGRGDIVAQPPSPTPAPAATPPVSFGLLQKPCDCIYTQKYHPGHYAVDMARNGGGPIFAAKSGVVSRADYGWNGGYGNVIEIDHGGNFKTLYAHNKELHVREGSTVRAGDVIASMGNTGRTYGRTGIHLHFEVIQEGVKKNPLLYLQ